MAWNMVRTLPADKLNRMKGWDAKGLGYWTARLGDCRLQVAASDSSGSLGRALEQRDIASEAVRLLTKP